MDTTKQRKTLPLRFAEFVVDPVQRSIQRRDTTIPLTPKTWAVLYYLASRPDQLVTKQELFEAVWPETVVSDAALSSCIKEIRRALDDRGRQPRYLKTAYGQGYRFIAPAPTASESPRQNGQQLLVGRAAELEQLQQVWENVLNGQRQVVFVIGEPGIGKTALVSSFVHSLSAVERVSLGQGQCVEQYGTGEAYLPVLSALSQMSHGPARETLVEVLRIHAPSWLLHLPALLAPTEREKLAAQYQGIPQPQAIRELAEALDVLSTHQPVVLVLEDLHWSDSATLAFVSALARRPAPARLFVLGTYRPVDVIVADHLLRQLKAELQLHGLCQEIALEYLNQAEVKAYVEQRLGEASAQLAAELHTRSGGNPLFLVNLVDYLQRQNGATTSADLQSRWQAMATIIPNRVQELIVMHAERLTAAERAVVEAASVNGITFFPTLVAAAIGREPTEVEALCEGLAQRGQFIHTLGEVHWPDGTAETQYTFQHELYRQTVYQRLAVGRRRRWHRAIGARLEAGYGNQARGVAAELALHFEQAQQVGKAIEYYQLTGQNALRRSAHREAVEALTKGVRLAESLPDSPARLAQQVELQTTLAPALMAVSGHTVAETEEAFLRARDLCEQAGDTPRLFFVLLSLYRLYNTRGEYHRATEYAKTCLSMATEQQDAGLFVGAHYALGTNAFYRGMLTEAQEHIEQGLARYTPQLHQKYILQYGFNHAVSSLLYQAAIMSLQGYPEQAEHQIELALTTAQDHTYTLVVARILAAVGLQFLRQEQAVLTQAETGVLEATRNGFLFWTASGSVLLGWGKVCQGAAADGIAHMRRGLAAMQEMGAMIHRAHYLTLLAEAVGRTGDSVQALQLIEQAFSHVDQSGERFYEAEVWRIKGELLLAQSRLTTQQKTIDQKAGQQAETCFLQAIDIACQQQAKSLELRGSMSLTRLWCQQGKQTDAQQRLAAIYFWFTEGFDTPDLQAAKRLLATLQQDGPP